MRGKHAQHSSKLNEFNCLQHMLIGNPGCHAGSRASVTRPELDAALSALEIRLVNWMIGALVAQTVAVAAIISDLPRSSSGMDIQYRYPGAP